MIAFPHPSANMEHRRQPATPAAFTPTSTATTSASPTLPKPLFDRIINQQWSSLTKADELTPYLPLLALHVDRAINQSVSAVDALSDANNAALLRLTAANKRYGDISAYTNSDIATLWTQTTAFSPTTPPAIPPVDEWESMGAAERMKLLMHELHRLHNELNASSTPTLASSAFTAPYSSHVGLILPLCLLHCTDFLSLAELTAILLRLSPPCADLLVTCVRNLPGRWESVLSAVLDEAEGEWVEWASAVSAATTIPPLLVAVSTSLHMLSQLSSGLATRIRSSWESLMGRLIPAGSSAASLLTARTSAAHLPPSVSFLAETALSLTVYFVKDTIGFLSCQYFPATVSSGSAQSQSSPSAISHLLLPYLAAHSGIPAPAGKEAKARADDQQPQSRDATQAAGAGAGGGTNKASASRDSPARPALIRSVSASQPTSLTHSSSPSSAHSKLNQPQAMIASLPASPIPPVVGLCRRHLSKTLHQLLVQRKLLYGGPPTPSSLQTIPQDALSENTAQCVTIVRLWCALSGVSGWQLEAGDATNLLLLISPASSDESSYMNDGAELITAVLCFLMLCRPISLATQLAGLWSMAHTSIRQSAISGLSSTPGVTWVTVTIDLLLSVYLAFCRRRSTEVLLPSLLQSALALSASFSQSPSSDWPSVITALNQEFGRNGLLTLLLPIALGRGGSVALHMQCVHWLLVNGSVERSLVVRCGYWLYELLSGERTEAAVLLSPLCWSLVELLVMTDVDSEVVVQAVDGRLLTEREMRLLLHIPLSSALVPPVSSSPASSFSSASDVCLAHHWLTSFTSPSFRSSLPSLLVSLYYVSYYDLLCYNSQRDDIVGLNPRHPPTAYPSTLLLSLPQPLISRLVLRHGGELGVSDSLRQLWAAVVVRGKERGEDVGWAVALPSPSTLPSLPSPAGVAELSVDAFSVLCADLAARPTEMAIALCWLYGLAHRQLIETSEWIASLSSSLCCLRYVDSVVDVLVPALLQSSILDSDVLSYFVPLCQLYLDVLSVTFAYALTRRLLPAEQSTLSLLAVLADPTVLLSCSSAWWTSSALLPLLMDCLSLLLLASRTHYRSLQTHYLTHAATPATPSTTDTPKSTSIKSHLHLTHFPHTAPPLPPITTSTTPLTVSSTTIESARDSLLRDSERRNYKRFPYSRLDEQREASEVDYHRRWQRLMDKGREALSTTGGEVDGLGKNESVWACVSVCAEWRVVQRAVEAVEVMRLKVDAVVSEAMVGQEKLEGMEWDEMRALLQSHSSLAGKWSSFIRQLSPPPPAPAVLDACRALSSFLLSLFSSSQLLPRLLLHRCTVPDELWPLLLQSQPELASHVFPHVLALLSSSEPRRSLHALRLMACIRLEGEVRNRWKPRLADVLSRLVERISGQQRAGGGGRGGDDRRGDKKRTKGKKRRGDGNEVAWDAAAGPPSSANGAGGGGGGGLDGVTGEWVRRGMCALLLLAREYTRHSQSLLAVVKMAAAEPAKGIAIGGDIHMQVEATQQQLGAGERYGAGDGNG